LPIRAETWGKEPHNLFAHEPLVGPTWPRLDKEHAMQGSQNAAEAIWHPAAGVSTRFGAGGVRGAVTIAGVFDDRIADAMTQGVLELLGRDVGEVWIDVLGVTQITSIAVAALLSVRRRTVRAGVRLVLVCDGGPLERILLSAGLPDAFTTVTRLPADLRGTPRAVDGDFDDTAFAQPLARATRDHSAPRDGTDLDGHPALPMIDRRVAPAARAPRPSARMSRSDRVSVLRADPDLAEGVPADRLVAAERELTAPVAMIRRGPWDGGGEMERGVGSLGLLVLEGLIVRRVGHAGGYGAELLGRGDVLRLREHPGQDVAPWFETMLHVIQPGRIAILDDGFSDRLRDHPQVAVNIVGRAMARSHLLTVSMAVAHYPRIERRLFATFWLLAQRWGTVSAEGVHLRLPLTHAILADLTASRRPSVTLALAQLERAGLLQRRGTDWVLLGSSPASLELPRVAVGAIPDLPDVGD
jgi:CRP/FNR family cyclic AMP-dependent transcriptional regulator